MANLYDHFVVIGSKCTFRYSPSTTSLVPMRVVCFLNDDTSVASTNPDNIAEQSSARHPKFIVPNVSNGTTFRLKFSAKKTFGSALLANNTLQGDSTADPSEQSYYWFSAKPADGSSTVGGYLIAEIEYITVWKELHDVTSL